ncbi:MAG: hypothetical protein ACJ763_05890 [Bdellovibrionia bacterium]
MSRLATRLLASLGLLFLAQSGYAETASLALLLGPAIRSVDGTAMGFELKGGYRVLPTLVTSLYYWRVSSGADISGSGTSLSTSDSMSSFGAEALYAFPGSNWSAGAKLGMSKNSKDGSASSETSTVSLSDSHSSLTVSPTVVYEIPVSFMVVGAEASYFYSLSSSVPKALSLMVEGKLRF